MDYINTQISKFRRAVIQNFPFIEEDFDAVTDYQLLSKVVEYLNLVIKQMNYTTDKMTEVVDLYNVLYNYVHDYFDNLDVQQEINNKLDALVEDGTFDRLISPYFDDFRRLINEKRNKSELIGMADLTQEVKTALTGGSTPVVGVDAVGNVNIINSQVGPAKIMANKLTYYGNLIDKTGSRQNWLINTANPNGVSSQSYDTSLPVSLSPGDKVSFSGSMAYFNYYDLSMVYISTQGSGNITNINLTIPENAAFIVVSYTKREGDNPILVNRDHYIGTSVSAMWNFDKPLYYNDNLVLSNDNIINNTIPINKLDLDTQDKINSIPELSKSDEGNQIDNRKIVYNRQTNDVYPDGRDYQNWFSTTPFEVDPTVAYRVSSAICYNNFYDENMVYISTVPQGTIYTNPVTVPENAKYCITSANVQYIDTIILAKPNYLGQNIPGQAQLAYYPALYYIIDSLINNNNIPDGTIEENKLSQSVQAKLNDRSDFFADKTINFLGDSITYGYDGAQGGGRVDNPYPTIIQSLINAETCNNYGINGSTIAGNGTGIGASPMCIRYANMADPADYIIVFGGTNDHGQSVPMGTNSDTTNVTFKGGIDVLIKGLMEKYPSSRIAFITPLRKDNIGQNSLGLTEKDYADAIIEKCNQYAIPYIDFYTISGCVPQIVYFRRANLPDGLHPNQSYYYTLAKKISAFIDTL